MQADVVRRGMPPKGGAQPGRAAGSLGGVGVVFQKGESGEGLEVMSLAIDGPAAQSGKVHKGDILVSIDEVTSRAPRASRQSRRAMWHAARFNVFFPCRWTCGESRQRGWRSTSSALRAPTWCWASFGATRRSATSSSRVGGR
jgi:hypothetical protein